MKRWKCTVCGYIHIGDQPPEKCPLCGADRSKFVEIGPEEAAGEFDSKGPDSKTEDPFPTRLYNKLTETIDKHHLHSIAVHIPNGVVPVAVILIVLAISLDKDSLAQAAYYNVIFVAAALPAVVLFGFAVWRKRYGGNLTRPFVMKMISGAVIFAVAIGIIAWRYYDPGVADESSSFRWLFLLVHLIMLGAATVAGHQGGKLVYKSG